MGPNLFVFALLVFIVLVGFAEILSEHNLDHD